MDWFTCVHDSPVANSTNQGHTHQSENELDGAPNHAVQPLTFDPLLRAFPNTTVRRDTDDQDSQPDSAANEILSSKSRYISESVELAKIRNSNRKPITAEGCSNQEHSLLTRLPAEIRHMIYLALFEDLTIFVFKNTCRATYGPSRHHESLGNSRKTRARVSAMFNKKKSSGSNDESNKKPNNTSGPECKSYWDVRDVQDLPYLPLTALAKSCKLAYLESIDLLYSKPIFNVSVKNTIPHLVPSMSMHHLSKIQNLELRFGERPLEHIFIIGSWMTSQRTMPIILEMQSIRSIRIVMVQQNTTHPRYALQDDDEAWYLSEKIMAYVGKLSKLNIFDLYDAYNDRILREAIIEMSTTA